MTIEAAGGFCSPIGDTCYELPTNNERPIRDGLVRLMDLGIARSKLPENERPGFDLKHWGVHASGRPDIAAIVSETRRSQWDEDDDAMTAGHLWDEPACPARLHYAR